MRWRGHSPGGALRPRVGEEGVGGFWEEASGKLLDLADGCPAPRGVLSLFETCYSIPGV